MRIAIIPARGGSKRIPQKNIKHFAGKPIIAYSIEKALASGVFDEVIVSTDCNQIAEIARHYGAIVPFIRPSEIADDFAVVSDVIRHAVKWYEDQGANIELACCLYATAPLMQLSDLKHGLDIVLSQRAQMCLSVTEFAFPILRALKLTEDESIQPFFPEYINERSQDLEQGYHDAAQFFIGTRDAFLHPEIPATMKAYVVDRRFVQDIDTQEDWEFAELLYKAQHKA